MLDPIDHGDGMRVPGAREMPPGDERHRSGLQQHGQGLHRSRRIRRPCRITIRRATETDHHGDTSSMSNRSPTITSRPA